MVSESAISLYGILLVLTGVLVFSVFQKKLKISPLLGCILIGILLGSSGIGFIEYQKMPEWLSFLSLLGSMLILFLVGLETHASRMMFYLKKAILISFLGIFFSGIFVFMISVLFYFSISQIVIIIAATIVTATSTTMAATISAHKIKTEVAHVLHAAAMLDNIIGILLISVLTTGRGMHISHVDLPAILGVIGLLGICILAAYFVLPKIIRWIFDKFGYPGPQTRITLAFSFMFFFSAIFAQFLYDAPFGAFFAGVALSSIYPKYKEELLKIITEIGESLFFPIFFFTLGLAVNISSLFVEASAIIFVFLYVLTAIWGKIVGAYLGGKIINMNKKESFIVGCGLIPRGELGLVIAQIGLQLAILDTLQFSSIIVMSVITVFVGFYFTYNMIQKIKNK
ncbi:MAG: cation:proton antiporter [archaeon]